MTGAETLRVVLAALSANGVPADQPLTIQELKGAVGCLEECEPVVETESGGIQAVDGIY